MEEYEICPYCDEFTSISVNDEYYMKIILSVFDGLSEAKTKLAICHDLGFDGIEYVKVNMFREEIQCANLTPLEKEYSKRNEKE